MLLFTERKLNKGLLHLVALKKRIAILELEKHDPGYFTRRDFG